MNELKYKHVYDRVGERNGWDFSKVKCTAEGEAWEFYREVARSCKKSDVLLDIGTGGGEKLLSMAHVALLLVGIDRSADMLKAARDNLISSKASNVRVLQMNADQLQFPDKFFNVVSCRHAPFHARETARVLADDGLFLTQQVSEHDKLNIVEAFGRSGAIGEDGTLKNKYVEELREAGFKDVQSFDYDATEWYESCEDFIFLLKHAPIIPDFGRSEHDFAILEQFINDNQTSRGIVTNSKRFMIVARKDQGGRMHVKNHDR